MRCEDDRDYRAYMNLIKVLGMTTLALSTSSLLAGPVNITRTNYHGWADSLWISNG
jgi:hypothetical protein